MVYMGDFNDRHAELGDGFGSINHNGVRLHMQASPKCSYHVALPFHYSLPGGSTASPTCIRITVPLNTARLTHHL